MSGVALFASWFASVVDELREAWSSDEWALVASLLSLLGHEVFDYEYVYVDDDGRVVVDTYLGQVFVEGDTVKVEMGYSVYTVDSLCEWLRYKLLDAVVNALERAFWSVVTMDEVEVLS